MKFASWALIILVVTSGCRVTSMPLWTREALPSGPYQVQRFRDLAYAEGSFFDAVSHSLDLYVPVGRSEFPVVVLVHGGEWKMGDNRCYGLYESVAEFLASQGIAAALPNYRLSPWVKHPEHAKDVAAAVAWTHRHIASYGGRPDRLFLAGHSAGGHLAALVATDETYLRAHGLSSRDLRGVVGVSGVYSIPPGPQEYTLWGPEPSAFHWDNVLPIRGAAVQKSSRWTFLPGIRIETDVFASVFGTDPEARRRASPMHHVRPGLPPFLLLYAERDLPTLAGMAEEFHAALVQQQCDVRLLKVEGRNHNSILFRAIESNDPVARAIVQFVEQLNAAH